MVGLVWRGRFGLPLDCWLFSLVICILIFVIFDIFLAPEMKVMAMRILASTRILIFNPSISTIKVGSLTQTSETVETSGHLLLHYIMH